MKKKLFTYLAVASLLCFVSLGVWSVSSGSKTQASGDQASSTNQASETNQASSTNQQAPAPVQPAPEVPVVSSRGVSVNMADAIAKAQATKGSQKPVVSVETSSWIAPEDLRKIADMGAGLNVINGRGIMWKFASLTNPGAGLNPNVNIGADLPNVRAKMNGVKGTIIRFDHNGNLPGRADVALEVPYAAGTALYFYYYNPATQLFEYQQSATVATVGGTNFVALSLTHCSDYVLTTAPLTSGVASGPIPNVQNAGRLDATPYTGI